MARSQAQSNQRGKAPRGAINIDDDISRGLILHDARSNSKRPAFPLAAYLWPAKGTVSLKYGIVMVLLATSLFKWATGLWTYSGMAALPFGIGFVLTNFRVSVSTNVWRLRGTETLDGSHHSFTHLQMVFS